MYPGHNASEDRQTEHKVGQTATGATFHVGHFTHTHLEGVSRNGGEGPTPTGKASTPDTKEAAPTRRQPQGRDQGQTGTPQASTATQAATH